MRKYKLVTFLSFLTMISSTEEVFTQEDSRIRAGYYIRFPTDILGARNFAPAGGILNIRYKNLDIGVSFGFLYTDSKGELWKVHNATETDFGIRIKVDILSSQNSSVFLSTIPAQYTIGKVKFLTYDSERELVLSSANIIMYRALLLGGSGIKFGNLSIELEIPLLYFIVQRTKYDKWIDPLILKTDGLSSIFDYPFICIYTLMKVF